MQDLAAQPDGNASAALKAQIDGRLTQVRMTTQQDRLIPPCASIVVCQFPVDKWHGLMDNPTTADAILDRLVHDAHRLVPQCESMRKNKPVVESGEKQVKRPDKKVGSRLIEWMRIADRTSMPIRDRIEWNTQ